VFAKGNDEPSVPVMTTVVAFVAATVRVEEVPSAIVVGFAVMVTVGAGSTGVFTVTVAEAVAVPPEPVTVIVYVVVCVGETFCVPVGCTAPMLLSICADVALVELQVRVELWPAVTVAGFALSETVGVGAVEGEDD
jgi:hypothetical protein